MNKLHQIIIKALQDNHATDIVTLDFQNASPFCDYFVIASASSNRLAAAIVRNVEFEVLKAGYKVRSQEGDNDSSWILLDCYEVVVHIFTGEERNVYQLEKIWGNLPQIKEDK